MTQITKLNIKSLLILTILPIFFISVYAETHIIEPVVEISAQLDRSVYYQDEKIYVTGEVSTIILNPNLSYQVGFDEGVIGSGQILITEDKQIDITLNPGGPMWSHENYTLILNYPPALVQIPFQFFNVERPLDEIPEEPEEVEPPFDLILDELAMQGLDNNLMRIADDIVRADADIDEMTIYLEQAIANNEHGKIQKYSERIGGLMAFVEICDNLVDMIYAEIQLHS